MKRTYMQQIVEDVRVYIFENINLDEYVGRRDDLEEELNDTLWIADSVTGNASGSYTFSRAAARENVLAEIELAAEAYREFCGDEHFAKDIYNEEWEKMDVTIRCYLLGAAINTVLDELEDSGIFDEPEEA